MASATFTMDGDAIVILNNLIDDADDIIQEMLDAAGNVGADALRTELRTVIGKGLMYDSRSTGELLDSVGSTPPLLGRDGRWNVKIGFNEPRRNQYAQKKSKKGRKTRLRSGQRSYYEITNKMIAMTIEYGKRSAKQPPKPFMARAKLKSEQAIRNAMEAAFRRRVSK